MPARSSLFEMPSPFDEHGNTVLLLEPPSAKVGELRARLLDESYGRPFVVDDGERRYLQFSAHLIQSAMRLKEPNALDLRYTQKMMSFLLFHPRPRRIVLIGLGGGSLIKYCYTRLPATHLTAVELDPDVIALRDAFLLPPDDERLQVLQADGAEYLAEAEKGIDVLLVDAFDKIGFAPTLANKAFFEQAKAKLSGSGVLVVNLAGEAETYAGVIGQAAETFDDRVIVFPVREDDNHVMLAFKDSTIEPGSSLNWRRLQTLAKSLRSKFGLDFPVFVDKMERAMRMGLVQREAGRGGR
ncbi:MAG: spermidine synthase-like protein [Rhodocyclaceae bacterium]|nr:MAG: spermidine synthase-like protein [Rhodocyclaceae bacterium]